MRILVAGFEPFGVALTNPSWEAVMALPEEIGGAEIFKLLLPVSFMECAEPVVRALDELKPHAVVGVGVAGRRSEITPERVAINVMDSRMPDNDGFRPVDQAVRNDGPAAYFATLPVKEIVTEISSHGIPAKLSNSAGTYVCNCLMYRLLDHISRNKQNIKAGFIHVPKSIPVTDLTRGLEVAIETITAKGNDN